MKRRRLLSIALGLLSAGCADGQVTFERIKKADASDWLSYSGSYGGHRFSALKQITMANVQKLRPAWIFQMDLNHKLETTPLVADGIMYVSAPPSNVIALDLKTGKPFWQYRRPIPADVQVCCGQVNRGVALLGDTVYVGTIDAHLVALDARTGNVRWDRQVDDYRDGYSITAAPLAVKDKIIVGVAGGEYGIRGFLDAYDAKTGVRAWRFWTVPEPGKPGSETWKDDSWKHGGAPTWLTGSYDAETNLLYWGVGNPGPDWNGDGRPGDNLYSNSLIALNPDTGQLKWHFQFTPHDVFDWDANQIPVLVDAPVGGKPRKLVVTANRNGFYYVLDRVSGEFLSGSSFVKQTWAERLDTKGRPVLKPVTTSTAEGTVIYPSVEGGTNWASPAFSPLTSLFYVAAREQGAIVLKTKPEYRRGGLYTGGGWRKVPGEEAHGAIRALQFDTGKLSWEFPLKTPPWAGVLATAGGLVFGGTEEGDVFALDAANGKLGWKYRAGGRIIANPITYMYDKKQFLAIASGQALIVFGLE